MHVAAAEPTLLHPSLKQKGFEWKVCFEVCRGVRVAAITRIITIVRAVVLLGTNDTLADNSMHRLGDYHMKLHYTAIALQI